MRHLEAIESNNYKHLPGGIFNRSFIRAYARAVDFDEKSALDLYSRAMQERGENLDEVATSPNRSRVYMDGDAGRSPMLNFALSVLLLGILCLGVYALYYAIKRRSGGEPAQANAAAPAPNQQAVVPPSAPTQEPTPEIPAGELRVQIRARDKTFWVTARQDEGKQTGGILKPGEPRDFAPQKSLLLKVGRANAGNIELTINGQAARLPSGSASSGDAEWLITKENFRQFLP